MMILQDNFYGAVVVVYLRAESHCEFHTAPGWPPILLTQLFVFTARCTLVQSAVLRSHVVCLSVRPSVCDVGEL